MVETLPQCIDSILLKDRNLDVHQLENILYKGFRIN